MVTSHHGYFYMTLPIRDDETEPQGGEGPVGDDLAGRGHERNKLSPFSQSMPVLVLSEVPKLPES